MEQVVRDEKYYLDDIFKPPANIEAKVWRFMDFAKFISMLSTSSLYFTRIDKFEDKLEGHLPERNRLAIVKDNDPCLYDGMFKSSREWQLCHFFNCWHISEHETSMMWRNYTDERFGVAIQSTYKLLSQEFSDNSDIKIGLVRYLDKQSGAIVNRDGVEDAIHLCYPLFTKDIVYSAESELRIMYKKIETNENWPQDGPFFVTSIEHGISIPASLSRIILQVVVSPYGQPFFCDAVIDVIDEYGYRFPVTQSSLHFNINK